MAWNEPGNNNNNNNNGGGDNKDPWGNKNRGGRDQGPPDLDEVFNKLSQKLSGKFGGGNKGGNNKGGSGLPSFGNGGAIGLGLIAVVAIAIWIFSGFYTIGESERGVVLRLGKYDRMVDPGLNWKPTFIDQVTAVNIQSIRSLNSKGLMLTKDENVVTVEMGVQYRVADARKYLYTVVNADDSLRQATDSALRAVIGDAKMDDILTSGRQVIRQRTQETLNRIIDKYDMGLIVVDVNFQLARPPEEVKASFDDAIAAREDEERFIREAEAYSNDILPKATGRAERLKKEAQGYTERTVNGAIGQIAQFEKLLPEYNKAPEVTRTRLYLDTMERVYSNTSKVLIDSESNGNLLYLPLDKMVGNQQGSAKSSPKTSTSSSKNYDFELEKNGQPDPKANTTGRTSTREGRY
ncbi:MULTISPECIES: FtsH protease activity modulator HflK [Aliivibrio]|uniref:Protein HflK n=1 Tax=Aliivibrio logei TaxID=688 RepID=A0A1B9P2V3_ALILO|nr:MULTISPECIES: FtsH protease activity modulator HflK [Aliivibrio]MBB1312302.1 FtsH protease activity modulator HflK [Aliivibrio sp. SR45-2]OCH22720.1 HflK protein [Aliivibrio logei]